VGCGSFFGGGGHFCVLAIVHVCFGGFVVISGQSSWFLSSRLQWWSVGVDVVAGWLLVIVGGVIGVVVVVVGDERKPCHMVFGWWFVW